ncbi:hypothetical protein ACQUSR_09435 [Streptomyces sp. P1-3]|uniref:hypothetical protein n=1 Tax=Streptomyces sp. P1-3 TaxID=3421658 RepID=UPI003D35FD07
MSDYTPHSRHRGAWIAPLLSTLVTLPIAYLCSIGVGFAGMSCDVGTETEIDRCNADVPTATTVYLYGLLLPLGLLLASWFLPWRLRHRLRRSLLAVLAPCSLILAYMIFHSLVDWPSS